MRLSRDHFITKLDNFAVKESPKDAQCIVYPLIIGTTLDKYAIGTDLTAKAKILLPILGQVRTGKFVCYMNRASIYRYIIRIKAIV
jgi:hypothetical protein